MQNCYTLYKYTQTEIYEQKGMSKSDASQFIEILSRYKEVFVDTMLVDELGMHWRVMLACLHTKIY